MWAITVLLFSALIFHLGYAVDKKLGNVEKREEIFPRNKPLFSRYSRSIEGGIGFFPENHDSKEINEGTTGTENKNASVYPNVITELKLKKLGDSYYHFATEKVTYFKATEFCRKHKMDLLSIESKSENDIITNNLRNLSAVNHVWTSGTDLHDEGKFIWLATGEPLTFTHWQPNQPDNLLAAEHCLEMLKIAKGDYVWNDSWCSYKYHFVCEAIRCPKFCIRPSS